MKHELFEMKKKIVEIENVQLVTGSRSFLIFNMLQHELIKWSGTVWINQMEMNKEH